MRGICLRGGGSAGKGFSSTSVRGGCKRREGGSTKQESLREGGRRISNGIKD